MSTLTIDFENTLFMNGVLSSEELSSDAVCSWIYESYKRQKEEIKDELEATIEMLENIENDVPIEEFDVENMTEEEKIEFIENLENVISEYEVKKPEITLIINSPGGEYDHLIQIYDTIQLLDASVRTVVNGSAFSAGAILAISGTCGKRYITPNSRLMFHAVSMGMEGKVQDTRVDLKEAERLNHQMAQLIKHHTGIADDKVQLYTDRDIYITPEEAVKLKMIDEIVTSIN